MKRLRNCILITLLPALLFPAQSKTQSILGCSVVPQSWGVVQQGLDTIFLGACSRHDLCYRACNPEGGPYLGYGYKGTCDTVLYSELLLACQTWSLILSFPNVEWVDRDAFLHDCTTYASYGYVAVLTYGGYVFLNGQCDFRCNVWACNQLGRTYGPSQQGGCTLFCGGFGGSRDCESRPWDYDCPPCPIGIDLQGNDFKLTGAQPPALFDLDADGTPDRTSWTRVQTKDGWLVLDRNGNGLIDDGREMFGTASPMLLTSSRPRNGYEVLKEFDRAELRGNENGIIDPGDAIFQALRLWLDGNRDAVSQPGELRSLAEMGIQGISLSFYRDDEEDQWGNVFHWWSSVFFEDGSESMSVDVFFQRLPE